MRVAVVGGGIQGAGVAIELALRGVTVDLFEKRAACVTQASFQNEGKIHLGFVYGNDRTLATARLLADGALRFQPILNRWLESESFNCTLSSPFHYLVHQDSLLGIDELSAFYTTVSAIVKQSAARSSCSYFGIEADAPVVRLSRGERDRLADGARIKAAFRTPEVAVDPESIANLLQQRLASDQRIRIHCLTEVTGVVPGEGTIIVTVRGPAGTRSEPYDHVVNASWEDLLMIDSTASMAPPGPWSFCLKWYLRVRGISAHLKVPSVTIVLGAFGDAVMFDHGDLYLSWYPVGCRSMSSEIRPTWPLLLSEKDRIGIRDGIYEELCRVLPSLRGLPHELVNGSDVKGGVIYAQGDTDIDDPASGLHHRHAVGVRSSGSYHSVNTGKYTLAPLFARLTADRILEHAR